MKTLLLSVALAALATAACGTCTGYCNPIVEVQLVGPGGTPVKPASGTVTINGTATAFSCLSGTDGGVFPGCKSGALQFTADHFVTMSLTVTDDQSRTFTGDVPLDFVDQGEMCGSRCRFAKPTVTLQ